MPDQPRDRERHARMREQFGLRTDRAWVDWVAEHGDDGGMTLAIPLTDAELREIAARTERATATIMAFRALGLPSDAGAWLDQAAGGVVRLLLAHPSAQERATAEAILAERGGGSIELVGHSARELDAVLALISAEQDAGTGFGQAVMSTGSDVRANTAWVTLRGDLHPEIPEGVQDAADAGTLVIHHPAEPAGWDPDQEPARAAPPPGEPRPRWAGGDAAGRRAHRGRCVRYVADHCIGGPLDTAERLAEDLELRVRVIYPGMGIRRDRRSNRINLWVNAEHIVRWVTGG